MKPFGLSTEKFPLVLTTLPPSVDDENLEEYFERFVRDVLSRREKFASLVDTRPLEVMPSSRLRERIGQWQKAHPEGDALNVGIAFITERPLVRGFMAALGLIFKPVVPIVYVATMGEAVKYADRQLGK